MNVALASRLSHSNETRLDGTLNDKIHEYHGLPPELTCISDLDCVEMLQNFFQFLFVVVLCGKGTMQMLR